MRALPWRWPRERRRCEPPGSWRPRAGQGRGGATTGPRACRAAAARAAGEEAGVGEARFFDLILRSALAERTGAGLTEVEEEVRHFIAGGPFFMQGWRARILLRLQRTEEAVAIWWALAPRIGELPPTAVEWLVAMTGHADLAVAAGDRDAAQRLRADLLPFAHLHVAARAIAPYDGTVAFVIGRLSAFLGDRYDAKTRFLQARDRATAMQAPWHATRAGEHLAELGSGISPLSPRETQIAHDVAAGRTNRAIAETLYISERTVEQHVRSILRKLDASNRSAIAAWMARHTP
jgi:DNA-binding CsgD family transcriptional regulator